MKRYVINIGQHRGLAMKKYLSKSIFAGAAMLGAASFASQAHATGIIEITQGAFTAQAGEITFGEVPLGTVNPTYTPGMYGGGAGAPTVTFGGYFTGQSLSGNPGVDCPGAEASGCVVGAPTG